MSFGLAETAKLAVDLSLKGNFASALAANQKALTGFNAKITDTQGRAYKAGQQIGTGIRRGALLAVSAVGALVPLLVSMAKEGQKAANTQIIFAKAIENSGKVTTANVTALKAQEDALLSLAGVDDELIKTEQTRLIQMGLTGDQVLKLTPLILDFSKATGVDLLTATKLAGKAVEGNTGALSRYGVQVDKAKAKTDPFAATMDALNKKFGGTTAALSGSLNTKLGVLRERLANIREEAGIKLLPVFTRIVDVVGSKLVPAFGKFIDAILPRAITGLNKLADFLDRGGGTDSLMRIVDTIQSLLPAIESGAKITGQVIGTAVHLFQSLPPEIQSLAVAGLAVNKLTGGLVTNLAGGIVETLGKSLFQRGGTPATPLFVADVTGGLGGAAGSAGLLGKFGGLLTKLAGLGLLGVGIAGVSAGTSTGGPAGAAIAAGGAGAGIAGAAILLGPLGAIAASVGLTAKTLLDIRGQNADLGNGIADSVGKQIAGGASLADLQQSLAAVDQGINDIQANPLNVLVAGDALDQLRAQRDLLTQQIGLATDTRSETAGVRMAVEAAAKASNVTQGGFDVRFGGTTKVTHALDAMHFDLVKAIHDLKNATKKEDVAKAIKEVLHSFVTKQLGGAGQTKNVLGDLRKQLAHTHDPELQRALRDAIAKVERKLAGREFAAKELATVKGILADGKITARESKQLHTVMSDLKNRGLPHAAAQIQAKIDAAKRAQVAAEQQTKHAADLTAQAIRAKDLSVTVNTAVSIRDIGQTTQKYNRYTTVVGT